MKYIKQLKKENTIQTYWTFWPRFLVYAAWSESIKSSEIWRISELCSKSKSKESKEEESTTLLVFLKIDWHLEILWITGTKRPLKNSSAAIPEGICPLTTGMHESLLWAVEFPSAVLQSQNAPPTVFPLV